MYNSSKNNDIYVNGVDFYVSIFVIIQKQKYYKQIID